jgi:hypothetical protein
VEGRILYDELDCNSIDDVPEVLQIIKTHPNQVVLMTLYGFNLVELREAFNGR